MTLEFEKLGGDVERMAQAAARLDSVNRRRSAQLRQLLEEHATNWAGIDAGIARAQAQQGEEPKYFRAARPLSEHEPLNQPISPGPTPDRATIIATDGSQILPDRHAAFLYYLINIGAFVYFHGDGIAPAILSDPTIEFPDVNEEDRTEEELGFDKSEVTIARDRREIEMLAYLAWEYRNDAPHTLALLDQRLLYLPFGGTGRDVDITVKAWTAAMTKARDAGAWLAGYIDRPGKRSVVTMLKTLLDEPEIDWQTLGRRPFGGELTDADLYATILGPGQRSPVFVDISRANDRFAETDPLNEVCFFYLNAGQSNVARQNGDSTWHEARALARVDIPRWVAQDRAAVAAVHSLIYDQCAIFADYPYALARADELAVVGRDDEVNLNVMIDLAMQKAGVSRELTSKARGKEFARGGRTWHTMP